MIPDLPVDTPIPLPKRGTWPKSVHLFDQPSADAILAALAAERPLLVLGEPGCGKSQLARAAAKELGRVFIPYVVDARSEARDLLWHFDAIARLADAQVAGAAAVRAKPWQARQQATADRLAAVNYIHPGPLWWAFDWGSAQRQADRVKVAAPHQADGGLPKKGAVVLIDEIDKAEADLPNGLLEALGGGHFSPQGLGEAVCLREEEAPLVIITTNEERSLPDAFVRRCLVLHLGLPKEPARLRKRLIARGRAHLEAAGYHNIHPELVARAAQLLAQDRAYADEQRWRPLPGQAEFLDLLWAVVKQHPDEPERQIQLIDEVACFLLKKHPDAGEQWLADRDDESGRGS